MARLRFDRTTREGWMIAASLACPTCGNRLYGDKVFSWCKAYDCSFVCSWEEVTTTAYLFNKNAMFSEDFTGSIHPIGHPSQKRFTIIYTSRDAIIDMRAHIVAHDARGPEPKGGIRCP